ncbi:MAG: ABC transporter permease [Firmicutes bacterium]|nr:ABC transporter permease [Bacillota bacterium]
MEDKGARLSDNAAVRRFLKNRGGMTALCVFLLITAACIFAPLICRYSYDTMNVSDRFMRPCPEHIFGCDYCGRDLFARVLYGGRMTLRIAATATAIGAGAGLVLGIASGYLGGGFDMVVMRVMEVLSAVPSLLLVVLAECLMGWGKGNFMYALAIAALPSFVRLVRVSVNQVMSRSYIEAAKALGAGGLRMVIKHIIPNILPSLFVHLTGIFAEQILLCSVMGYVGIGVNPPKAEWGLLVYEGYTNIRANTFTALIPAAVITLCVLSINLVGNALRDSLDGGERSDG